MIYYKVLGNVITFVSYFYFSCKITYERSIEFALRLILFLCDGIFVLTVFSIQNSSHTQTQHQADFRIVRICQVFT